MKAAAIRLGVDIGGTFTDVVLEKEGAQFSTKVLTTYAAPEKAIIDGMQQVCAKASITPDQIGQIIHGKGIHAILKNHVKLWLEQHPSVLAFCSAPPQFGGSGSVLVLVKKG